LRQSLNTRAFAGFNDPESWLERVERLAPSCYRQGGPFSQLTAKFIQHARRSHRAEERHRDDRGVDRPGATTVVELRAARRRTGSCQSRQFLEVAIQPSRKWPNAASGRTRSHTILVIASMGTDRIAPEIPHIQNQKTSERTTRTGFRVNRLARSIGVTVSPSTK
jgi:hypothetical protein